VAAVQVEEGSEPPNFTKHFRGWHSADPSKSNEEYEEQVAALNEARNSANQNGKSSAPAASASLGFDVPTAADFDLPTADSGRQTHAPPQNGAEMLEETVLPDESGCARL
jgi:hypothetical protein